MDLQPFLQNLKCSTKIVDTFVQSAVRYIFLNFLDYDMA